MAVTPDAHGTHHPQERLSGSMERVTCHSEASGYCVLRVKSKGQKDLVTVLGSAATIRAGEYREGIELDQRPELRPAVQNHHPAYRPSRHRGRD
jgi:hypothetical protein